jgi:hypothetical protein
MAWRVGFADFTGNREAEEVPPKRLPVEDATGCPKVIGLDLVG